MLTFSSFWLTVLSRRQIEVMRKYDMNTPGWQLLRIKS